MNHKHAPGRILLLALLLSCFLVSTTYPVLNNTFDEVFHIAGGMEWLQYGTYTFEYQHPPIARIALALGPYLDGFRIKPNFDMWTDSLHFLYTGDYWRILTLARIGNLIFLIQGAIMTFLWGKRWFSPWTGALAATLFLSLPPILGHAGMATLDVACAVSMVTALYLLIRWREQGTPQAAAWAAIGVSYAFLCKFSNLVFLSFSVLALTPWLLEGLLTRWQSRTIPWRTLLRQSLIFAAVCIVVTFAVYRFHIGNLNDHIVSARPEFKESWNATMASLPPSRAQAVQTLIHLPLPFLEIAHGLREVAVHNKKGHQNFLLGEFSMHGHWYFFPLVILLKTPPAFLVLLAAGVILLLLRWRTVSWPARAVLLSPAATLLFCAFSDINIGIRHCLVVFPFFSLLAAYALTQLGEASPYRMASRILRGLLLAGVFYSTLSAQPDFLAYFNFLAGEKPEEIVVESDLDWGQDLQRLSNRLAERKIDSLHLAYHGTAKPSEHGLPHFDQLDTKNKVSGWVAISTEFFYLYHARDGSYHWLKNYQPVERIGKSILLFHIEP